MSDLVFFFGCNMQAGHYLIAVGNRSVRDFEADKWAIPRAQNLDGGPMFLPFPEKVGNGALTYLPANDFTVLAWWGSPYDKRGAVNSAIIASGKLSEDECWAKFSAGFPTLAPNLPRPTVTRNYRG